MVDVRVQALVVTATSSLRLGTLMSPVTFHQPGPLAVQVAQRDELSDGRIELGLGAGWYEPEHRGFGIDFGGSHPRLFDLEDLDDLALLGEHVRPAMVASSR